MPKKESDNLELARTVGRVFASIPKEDILKTACDIQGRLASDPSLIEAKDMTELVTQADKKIQNEIILPYMDSSPLGGTFLVKAEEELDSGRSPGGEASWQLVVDPLDGTEEFCAGGERWGAMVGACDLTGRMFYSWNLLSSGEVFMTGDTAERPLSFAEKQASGRPVAIDIYDYSEGAAKSFTEYFTRFPVQTTSYPAAVWAGARLYHNDLDGILWLPSDSGKRNYPDYDLVFLGALNDRGFKMRLGKNKSGGTELVAVAPDDKEADYLLQTGLAMITDDKRQRIDEFINDPFITGPAETNGEGGRA